MSQLEAIRQQVTELMTRTGQEHHKAFEATDGEDPEWPIWYAEYLQKPLGKLLQKEFTRSQLVYCVMFAEFEREARAKEAKWAPYYSDHFLERFAPAEVPAQDRLALYYFPTCPFCIRVLSTIERVGIDVELRNIREEDKHWNDLVKARGRGTVPVLRIDSPDGTERWMPESADILRYLEKTYGRD